MAAKGITEAEAFAEINEGATWAILSRTEEVADTGEASDRLATPAQTTHATLAEIEGIVASGLDRDEDGTRSDAYLEPGPLTRTPWRSTSGPMPPARAPMQQAWSERQSRSRTPSRRSGPLPRQPYGDQPAMESTQPFALVTQSTEMHPELTGWSPHPTPTDAGYGHGVYVLRGRGPPEHDGN